MSKGKPTHSPIFNLHNAKFNEYITYLLCQPRNRKCSQILTTPLSNSKSRLTREITPMCLTRKTLMSFLIILSLIAAYLEQRSLNCMHKFRGKCVKIYIKGILLELRGTREKNSITEGRWKITLSYKINANLFLLINE